MLFLSSDWKWTGPSEPMLLLQAALRERGHRVDLACAEAPGGAGGGLAREARARGLGPHLALERGRGIRPLRDRRDARLLAEWIARESIEVVHTWHSRDHGLALAARARCAAELAVVRSLPAAKLPSLAAPWNRWLFGPGCDGLVCVGQKNAERLQAVRGARPLASTRGVVDAERFSNAERFGGAANAFRSGSPRIGIVARVQAHRRFDLLVDAFALLAAREQRVKLVVIGRGTRMRELLEVPVRRRGLEARVEFMGYRREDYREVLARLDVSTLLVPGSDGSCRAVLEAAAAGIPCVVTRREPLPEIVLDRATGLVVEEDPEALAAAWSRLLNDGALRRRLGEAARERVRSACSPARHALEIEALQLAAVESRRAR
ncbi:MAG: glycosyltransferase family 4 protein [Myxococcota bacterium]